MSVKQKVGALLLDWPRLLWALSGPAKWGADWTRYGNRRDRLIPNPAGLGVQCDWMFSRPLHLCNMFPSAGRWLMSRALRDWPIRMAGQPLGIDAERTCWNGEPGAGPPDISFVIGHRGLARLPQLLQTLKSIAAQEDVRFECIVVEQDVQPVVRDSLPQWVRYVHTPMADPAMPYCRSWAFNVGANIAKAHGLVFHDNDMLIPVRYAAEIAGRFKLGCEVINLKRFIFYLAGRELDQKSLFESGLQAVSRVIENLEAGGSVAVARQAWEAIGGFDEEFIGWGGEDIEFWDRCLTRNVWSHGYLPIVHLWHEAQPGRRAVNGLGLHTVDLTLRRRALKPAARIAELVSRPRGALSCTKRMAGAEGGGSA